MNRFPLYRFFLTGLNLFYIASLSAQIDNAPIEPDKLQALLDPPTWKCETVSLAPPDADILMREDADRQINGEPYRIAKVIPTSISSLNSGNWMTNKGVHYWLLKVRSDRAKALFILFDNFKMQDGEEFYLLNKDKTTISGPYNNKNVHASLKAIFSDPVNGDEAFVVFKSRVRSNVRIQINGVGYDYHMGSALNIQCRDILCETGDCWRVEAQSIARFQYIDGLNIVENGSGALVNAIGGNTRPYILTARHNIFEEACGFQMNNMLYDPANMKFIFFSWYTECEPLTPVLNSRTVSFLGAELKTDACCMDVALLQLLGNPLEGGSSFAGGLVYAGWDTDPSPPQSGALLHYPAIGGFPQNQTTPRALKVSTSGQPPVTIEKNGCSDNYWGVMWNVGGTKVGSSGAPFFKAENHKIVGTNSHVDNGFPICAPILQPTLMGKFHHSYLGGAGYDFSHGPLMDYLGSLPPGQTSMPATMVIEGPQLINPGDVATFRLNFMAPLPSSGYIFEWSTDMNNVQLTWDPGSPVCTAQTTDVVSGSGHIAVTIKMDGSCAGTAGSEILTSQKDVCVNVYYVSTANHGPYVEPLTVNHHQFYNLWLTPAANITSIEHIYYEHFTGIGDGCRETVGNPVEFNHYTNNAFLIIYYFHYDYQGCSGEGGTNLTVLTSTTSGGELCYVTPPPDDRSEPVVGPVSGKGIFYPSPNPFTGSTKVYIRNRSSESAYSIQVFDILGRVVQSSTPVSSDNPFDLGMNWPYGTYKVLLFRDGVLEDEMMLIKSDR